MSELLQAGSCVFNMYSSFFGYSLSCLMYSHPNSRISHFSEEPLFLLVVIELEIVYMSEHAFIYIYIKYQYTSTFFGPSASVKCHEFILSPVTVQHCSLAHSRLPPLQICNSFL